MFPEVLCSNLKDRFLINSDKCGTAQVTDWSWQPNFVFDYNNTSIFFNFLFFFDLLQDAANTPSRWWKTCLKEKDASVQEEAKMVSKGCWTLQSYITMCHDVLSSTMWVREGGGGWGKGGQWWKENGGWGVGGGMKMEGGWGGAYSYHLERMPVLD